MPKADEVLVSLLLSYPNLRSLGEVSLQLDLDNDTVMRSLRTLQKCGLCSRKGKKWFVPKKSYARARKYVEAIMNAEDSLNDLWEEAIELRHYDRSLCIANRMISSGNIDGLPYKAISLLWLDFDDEAMMFAEQSLKEDELHPVGWRLAAEQARRMNHKACAETFDKVAMLSEMKMEASA